MTDDARLHMPAFNLNRSVRNFNLLAGRTLNIFNPDQAGFHIGLVLEEVAETIEGVHAGTITPMARESLAQLIGVLKFHAREFKAHAHTGDVLRGDRLMMLDGSIDTGVVTLGLAYSLSNNVDAACAEVDRANMDKFPGGVVTKDDNGKVVKPAGWREPDLSPFITLATE